jgi:hypothetical protein
MTGHRHYKITRVKFGNTTGMQIALRKFSLNTYVRLLLKAWRTLMDILATYNELLLDAFNRVNLWISWSQKTILFIAVRTSNFINRRGGYFEIFATYWRNTPEDSNLHSHVHVNFKSHKRPHLSLLKYEWILYFKFSEPWLWRVLKVIMR